MKPAHPRILIVDDDPTQANTLRRILADHYRADVATVLGCAHAARIAVGADSQRFDLVLADLNLPDRSGLWLTAELHALRADLPVILITGESNLDTAREAIRRGAWDYVIKVGGYLKTVPLVVEKNLQVWRIKADNVRLQARLEQTLHQLQDKNQQLEKMVEQLEAQASTDPLTGLANRRAISDVLDRRYAETQRDGSDLTCLMIDLDCFKPINDMLGHQMGDRLLKTAARVLSANCRRSDVAGRYGGDEFVLLLPRTDLATGFAVARRIQHQFRQATHVMLPEGIETDMSLGLASVLHDQPCGADQLVAKADAALYRAKQAGKGRVAMHDPPGQLPLTAPAPDN